MCLRELAEHCLALYENEPQADADRDAYWLCRGYGYELWQVREEVHRMAAEACDYQ